MGVMDRVDAFEYRSRKRQGIVRVYVRDYSGNIQGILSGDSQGILIHLLGMSPV